MERRIDGKQIEGATYEACVKAGISIVVKDRHPILNRSAKKELAKLMYERLNNECNTQELGEYAGIGMKRILRMV